MKSLCFLAIIFITTVNGYAQYVQIILQQSGPIVPDRPGQTNPPDVVGSGTVQLRPDFYGKM